MDDPCKKNNTEHHIEWANIWFIWKAICHHSIHCLVLICITPKQNKLYYRNIACNDTGFVYCQCKWASVAFWRRTLQHRCLKYRHSQCLSFDMHVRLDRKWAEKWALLSQSSWHLKHDPNMCAWRGNMAVTWLAPICNLHDAKRVPRSKSNLKEISRTTATESTNQWNL